MNDIVRSHKHEIKVDYEGENVVLGYLKAYDVAEKEIARFGTKDIRIVDIKLSRNPNKYRKFMYTVILGSVN